MSSGNHLRQLENKSDLLVSTPKRTMAHFVALKMFSLFSNILAAAVETLRGFTARPGDRSWKKPSAKDREFPESQR